MAKLFTMYVCKNDYVKEIKTICVCGAGTMGSGISQVAAQAGYKTIQYDLSNDMLAKSKAGIESSLNKLALKQKISWYEKDETLSRLIFTNNINDCVADIIIEAIIEKEDVKISLFNTLAEINNHHCIFATNTSSLSVNTLAEKIKNPERFAGMHFFNPAPVMKLVELVKGKHTGDKTIETLMQLTKQMGKTPVVCKDLPGFIVNRVARHYYLEAMYMVEKNKINIADADAIMEASGFKMGPFKLMDLIGLDINYSVSNTVWQALGHPERLTPSGLQKIKVQAGQLGKKTGKGFYNY